MQQQRLCQQSDLGLIEPGNGDVCHKEAGIAQRHQLVVELDDLCVRQGVVEQKADAVQLQIPSVVRKNNTFGNVLD